MVVGTKGNQFLILNGNEQSVEEMGLDRLYQLTCEKGILIVKLKRKVL